MHLPLRRRGRPSSDRHPMVRCTARVLREVRPAGHEGIDFVAPLGARSCGGPRGRSSGSRPPRQEPVRHPRPYPEHLDGYETIYGHFRNAIVKLGQGSRRGQQIGYADSTGNSFGNHLHLTLKHASDARPLSEPHHRSDALCRGPACARAGRGRAMSRILCPDGTQFQPGQAVRAALVAAEHGHDGLGRRLRPLAYLSGDRWRPRRHPGAANRPGRPGRFQAASRLRPGARAGTGASGNAGASKTRRDPTNPVRRAHVGRTSSYPQFRFPPSRRTFFGSAPEEALAPAIGSRPAPAPRHLARPGAPSTRSPTSSPRLRALARTN